MTPKAEDIDHGPPDPSYGTPVEPETETRGCQVICGGAGSAPCCDRSLEGTRRQVSPGELGILMGRAKELVPESG